MSGEEAADWRDVRGEVFGYLRESNPSKSLQAVTMYADAFAEYRAAMANIREHGSVVVHPRTGSPMDNPFLKVRDGARKALNELTKGQRWELDELWDESEDDEGDEEAGG